MKSAAISTPCFTARAGPGWVKRNQTWFKLRAPTGGESSVFRSAIRNSVNATGVTKHHQAVI